MSVSSIATMFSESPELSSSSELSEELITALAEGRWWAIMEVSDPINEVPDCVDLISGQWGETMEAGGASCPTSLVYNEASEKAQRNSQHLSFTDATLKTSKQWRQKTMPVSARCEQGAPVLTRSNQGAPVLTRSEQGAPVLTGSNQGAPVLTRSEKREPVPTWFKQGAPVLTRSVRRDPVPTKSGQGAPDITRSKRGAPVLTRAEQREPVPTRSEKREPVPTWFKQGAPVLTRSVKRDPVPTKSEQGAPVFTGSKQGAPVPARFKQGAPVLTRSVQREPVPTRSEKREPLPTRSKQGAPLLTRSKKGEPVLTRSEETEPVPTRSKQGAPVRTRAEQREPVLTRSKPETPLPIGSQIRGKLRIPDHLIKHLQKASYELGVLLPAQQGACMPSVSLQDTPKTPQRAHVVAPNGAPRPDKIMKRQRLKIPEPLRRDLLWKKPLASSVLELLLPAKQGACMPSVSLQDTSKTPQRAPVVAPNGAPRPDKIIKRQRLKIPEPLRRDLLQKKPLASSVLELPLPAKQGTHMPSVSLQDTSKTPQRAPVVAPKAAPRPDKILKRQRLKIPEPLRQDLLQKKPLAFSVKGLSTLAKSKQGAIVPERTPVGAPVHTGIQQGAAVPAMSPHVAPVSAESQKGALIHVTSSQEAPMPSRIQIGVLLNSGTPQVPVGYPQQAENPWQWRQKKILKGFSVPAMIPQKTQTFDNGDMDQSPTQKLFVETDNKAQLKLKRSIHKHELHQRTWSRLNQKRALDNAGVDQSPPPKLHTDQQLEAEQIDDLCHMFIKCCVISHI